MQPCLQGGLAEALHAVHCLARRAEHGELLPVRRALVRGSVITKGLFKGFFFLSILYLLIPFLHLHRDVDDVVLGKHLGLVHFLAATPAQSLA